MERRHDSRIPTDLPVTVLHLDDDTETTGGLLDISESGICAHLPTSLAPGSMVQVNVLEVSLYGEIVYSQPDGDGFRTGIFVEQVLLETSNVSKIVESYFAATASAGRMADTAEPLA